MTEPTDEERQRMEAEADAEADRQLDAVRKALNSALEDLGGEAVHPVTIVQALIVLAVQLAVGNLGREDARSLLNETLSDGLAGAAKIGIDEPTHSAMCEAREVTYGPSRPNEFRCRCTRRSMTADNKIDSFHTTHHSDPPITFGIRVLYP